MGEDRTPYLLALTTCPDRETAERVAGSLVSERLAACVSVVQGLTSFYEWEGEIQKDEEFLLLIKTRRERFDTLKDALLRLHPYELPELVGVALDTGLDGYLRWIDRCVDLEH